MFEKTANGTEIIKREDNKLGYEVSLTRRTTKSGNIRHGVVLTNKRTGGHMRMKSYLGIAPAFNLYKTFLNAE